MQWIELSIVCERVATDEVTTLFGDYADNGIIEEDIENELDKIKLTLYCDPHIDIEAAKQDLTNRLTNHQITVFSINSHMLDESTWYNSWKQYIEPVEILPNLIIKPAWQEYSNEGNKEIIEIDSDLSFGTGSHETTRSCAQLIHRFTNSHQETIHKVKCLDIGTGTGILLLVAAKLGITNLIGIDIDNAAAEQARINMNTNEVTAQIIHGDLDRDFHDTADLVIANLTVDPLKMLLPVIGQKLSPNGVLIISGIIDDRYDEIMPYILDNWRIQDEIIDGPWHTFDLRKK